MNSTSKNNARPLRWSKVASDNLFDIWAFIYKENPKAADEVAKRIHVSASQLVRFPMIGKLSGYYRTRVLIVKNTQINIYYRITTKNVVIVRLIHQRQNFPL